MFIDFLHFLHKDLPVLRHLDGGNRSPQNLDFVLLQNTQLGQLHATIQRCLTAKRQQNAVRALIFYHLEITSQKYNAFFGEPLGSINKITTGI